MTCSTCKQDGHNKKTCTVTKNPLAVIKKTPTAPQPTPSVSEETPATPEILAMPTVDTPDIAFIDKLAREIISELGPGHTESVYHNAMKIGFQHEALKFETEVDIILKFRGSYVGTCRADLILEKRVVIELKSSLGGDTALSDAMEQCRIYMKETKIPAGIVVVFPKRVDGKLLVKSVQ